VGSEGGGGHGPMVAEAWFAGEGKGIGGNDLANLGCSGFGGGRTGARRRGGWRRGADESWTCGGGGGVSGVAGRVS